MARHHRNRMPAPPVGGGCEFEVVELGPPIYFNPPTAPKARGGLTPAGEGDGLVVRSAPHAERKRRKEERQLRTFTARFRNADASGSSTVTIQGHELQYDRDSSVVEVLVHQPTGPVSVAIFSLSEILGLFDGRIEKTAEYSPQ